jgi:hypothetical protein
MIEWTQANRWLLMAATLSLIGALLHIGCIFGGANWYRALGAGERLAQAASRGQMQPHVASSPPC